MASKFIVGGALIVLLGVGALAWYQSASAADHRDGSITQDQPADLADLYVFVTPQNNLVTILTFDPDVAQPRYDTGMLYSIHIDNDDDNVADSSMHVRFGTNAAGAFGVQALDVPGAGGPVTGAVQTTLTDPNGVMLFAGMTDDPFFADMQGLDDTFATSTLAFNNSRDGFAGKNVMAIVLELPVAAASPSLGAMRVWATTGRE